MEKLSFKVTSLDANQRIDKYIKKQLNLAPASFIYKLFRLKDIKVNNQRVQSNYIIGHGDEISVFLTLEQKKDFYHDYTFSHIALNSDILFEDENIVVIDKTRGLLVHGDINEKDNTLANQVLTYLYDRGEFDPKERGYIPSPINRIDKNTSGLVVFAKKQQVHQELNLALHNNDVSRRYIALVHGHTPKSGTISVALEKDAKRGLVSANPKGKVSLTKYTLIKQYQNYALVDIELETGRSNQIRVHFANLKHPIVGDHKYGVTDQFSQLLLHHNLLKFYNIKGVCHYLENVELTSPLPKDFRKILNDIEE